MIKFYAVSYLYLGSNKKKIEINNGKGLEIFEKTICVNFILNNKFLWLFLYYGIEMQLFMS